MKKLVFLTIAFLFAIIDACDAQVYGIKVAYTSSWQNTKPGSIAKSWHWPGTEISPIPGFGIAAFAEWNTLPFLSIVTQLEYDRRGGRLDYSVPGGTLSTNGRIGYLSIPVLAKMSLMDGSSTPYLIAGPRIDFLTDYHDFQIQPDLVPVYGAFKKTMLGCSMGGGFDARSLLPVDLLVELRYNIDFFNSFNSGGAALYNNSLDLWIGVGL